MAWLHLALLRVAVRHVKCTTSIDSNRSFEAAHRKKPATPPQLWKRASAHPITGVSNRAGTAEHEDGMRHMAESERRNVGEDERLDCSPCTPVASDVPVADAEVSVHKASRMDEEACLLRMERA